MFKINGLFIVSIDADDCENNNCVNGQCVDGKKSYACNCTSGYVGEFCNGKAILLLNNLREIILHKITVNSTSILIPFSLIGAVEVDECASNPCTNGQCVDGSNQYTCYCNSGFMGTNCQSMFYAKLISVPISFFFKFLIPLKFKERHSERLRKYTF